MKPGRSILIKHVTTSLTFPFLILLSRTLSTMYSSSAMVVAGKKFKFWLRWWMTLFVGKWGSVFFARTFAVLQQHRSVYFGFFPGQHCQLSTRTHGKVFLQLDAGKWRRERKMLSKISPPPPPHLSKAVVLTCSTKTASSSSCYMAHLQRRGVYKRDRKLFASSSNSSNNNSSSSNSSSNTFGQFWTTAAVTTQQISIIQQLEEQQQQQEQQQEQQQQE